MVSAGFVGGGSRQRHGAAQRELPDEPGQQEADDGDRGGEQKDRVPAGGDRGLEDVLNGVRQRHRGDHHRHEQQAAVGCRRALDVLLELRQERDASEHGHQAQVAGRARGSTKSHSAVPAHPRPVGLQIAGQLGVGPVFEEHDGQVVLEMAPGHVSFRRFDHGLEGVFEGPGPQLGAQ